MNRTSRSSRLGQDRGEVARPLDRRARRVADVDPELAGDDRRERRLAEAGRAVQQDVVRRLSPRPRRRQQDREVGLDLALADVLVERPRPEGAFDHDDRRRRQVRREDPRERRRPSGGVYQPSVAFVQMFDSITAIDSTPPMTPLDYVIWSLFTMAVAVRILAGSRAINLYVTKYKRRMPSNWLWTPVDDPEVERWRRRAAVAPLLAILGLSLLFVKLVVVG